MNIDELYASGQPQRADPAEIVAGNNPFNELVVAEIEFFGREVTPTQ